MRSHPASPAFLAMAAAMAASSLVAAGSSAGEGAASRLELAPGCPRLVHLTGPVQIRGQVTRLGAGEHVVIEASLWLGESPGPRVSAQVMGPDGRFDLALGPFHAPLLPGRYRVVVGLKGRDDVLPLEKPLHVGDAEAIAQARCGARTSLVRTLEWLRRAFVNLERRWLFLNTQRQSPANASLAAAQQAAWEQTAQRDFELLARGMVASLVQEARSSLRDLVLSAPLRPWPAAETATTQMLSAVIESREARRTALATPGKAALDTAGRQARERVLALAARLASILAPTSPAPAALWPQDWADLVLAQPEEGDFAAREFQGLTTGFSVVRPAGWQFTPSTSRHELRLIIRPTDPALASAWAVVEVRDLSLPPTSNPADQLEAFARAVEVATWERWTSYRRLSGGGPSRRPDPALPAGTRAACQLHFQTEIGQQRQVFEGRSLELLSRDGSRVIALLVLAPPATFKALSDQVETLLGSFQLHD